MMTELIKKFNTANKQTKYIILMAAIYIVALIWSTLQAYARLEYSRSDRQKTIVIQNQNVSHE